MIIGLSGYAQAGKDTVAQMLVEDYGYTRLGFADIIKKACYYLDPIISLDGMRLGHAFDSPATSAKYVGVQFYLEDELGVPVDLVTQKAIRPELRAFIEREAVNV